MRIGITLLDAPFEPLEYEMPTIIASSIVPLFMGNRVAPETSGKL